MRVAELWRYPVKSLRGEPLKRAAITAEGIPGDRAMHVLDARDELLTARTQPELLALAATVGEDGGVLVDGHRADSAEAAQAIEAAAWRGVRMVPSPGGHRFDDTPLLVATDGAIAHMGVDRRRFRPNILIEGVEGLAERDWPGRRLRIGTCVIAVEKLCLRCLITTVDPDSLEQDAEVLRRINDELDGLIALNCHVDTAGEIAVGDAVELV